MSKAFLREDSIQDEDLPPPPARALPPGTKNYITAAGLGRLRQQLADLAARRSSLLENRSDPDARRRSQILEQRQRYLQQSLQTAEVVPTSLESPDVVRFGSTVTVRDQAGAESVYRIVGVDETDLDRGDVSWQSPLAQALLNARKGERVRFKAPRGELELEIVAIAVEPD